MLISSLPLSYHVRKRQFPSPVQNSYKIVQRMSITLLEMTSSSTTARENRQTYKMPATDNPPCRPRCKTAWRPTIRQTRIRSRVVGAAPLMTGLDDKGQPREALPRDPDEISFDEAVRRVHRPRVILHCRPAAAPQKASRRPKIILRVSKAASKASRTASWSQYSSVKMMEDWLSNLYHRPSRSSGGGSAALDTGKNLLPRDLVRARRPQRHTDF